LTAPTPSCTRRPGLPKYLTTKGIKGAQAVALAVFVARTKRGKALIKGEVVFRFGYDLDRTVKTIRPVYGFDVPCQGTVQEAIIAFLNEDSYEDDVRKAISLGGDSDTRACITPERFPKHTTVLYSPRHPGQG
jgi:ADP-ribosylglycohydrolase